MLALIKKILIATVLLSIHTLPLQADQLAMPNKHSYYVENAPIRGSLQSDVLSQYGEPSSKRPGVGQPAISSWSYPGFKVFFENRRVIHSVGHE